VKLNKGHWATGGVAAIAVVAFVVFLAAHSSAARARFLQEEKEKRENISALLGAAKEDFKARDYGKAREALEEVLALDKENGKAIRFLAAVEDARKAAEKRRSWAERKKKATDLARKGDEARSRFQGVHIRRMAFLKRLMDSWDEHGPGYESGQVNRTVNELRACASEARALEDRALELFDQALLLDAENTDAHRGIASVRMDACEAAFQTALRSGDFAEVERLLFLAEQHDRARDQAERIREIRKWIHWEQAVEIRPSPRGDIVEIYRVDLEIGVETSLGTSNSGDFRLKPGSYVAVIAKRGYVRTRLPFVVECPKADGGAAEVLHLGVRLVLDEEQFKGMAYVPDGIFLMGGGGGKRGGEQRRVRLPAYFIDMKEVTGAAFEVFLDRLARENPSLLAKYRPRYNITILPEHMTMRKDAWGKTRPDPFRPEDYSMAWILHEDGTWSPQKDWKGKPVGGICYEAARAFASSLGKRLPTSQEWEKAARGVDGRRYPWGNRFDEKRASNVRHPEYDPLYGWRMIRPGSAMKDGASPYGVLHMAGNLAEWTSTNSRGENKINRGGCAFDEIPMLRCASRDDTFPGDYNSALGFRCVRDAE
jgi:formylglycine-generating enzyme required for sulfatase activity